MRIGRVDRNDTSPLSHATIAPFRPHPTLGRRAHTHFRPRSPEMIAHPPSEHYGLFDHFSQKEQPVSSTRSVSEVKAKLSDYIREAEHGEPVIITRHGRPVAALVGATELAALERLRAAGPEAGLASVAGGWEGSDELIRSLDESERVGSRTVLPPC